MEGSLRDRDSIEQVLLVHRLHQEHYPSCYCRFFVLQHREPAYRHRHIPGTMDSVLRRYLSLQQKIHASPPLHQLDLQIPDRNSLHQLPATVRTIPVSGLHRPHHLCSDNSDAHLLLPVLDRSLADREPGLLVLHQEVDEAGAECGERGVREWEAVFV